MTKITSISSNCLKLIEQFECSGNVDSPKWLNAYQDTGGVWTIGIGTIRYFGGRKVAKGDCITVDKAYELLRFDLKQTVIDIDALTVDSINQNQFDALVSFGYNVGSSQIDGPYGPTGGYKNSTLRRVINQNPNDFEAIIPQFLRWKYDNGVAYNGLLRRRQAEAWLYWKGELKYNFLPTDKIIGNGQ